MKLKSLRLSDWLQLLALAGVIAGLLAVTYELRQNTKFARASHLAGWTDNWVQVVSLEIGTEIGDIVIRAVEDPDSLTPQEIFKYEGWLWHVYFIHYYQFEAARVGVGLESVFFTESGAKYYFASSHARKWFARWRHDMPSEMGEAVDRVISTTPVATSWPPYDEEIISE